MGFRRASLQEAIGVPGDHGFRIWGYGTTDPLAEVLAPGYFRAAGALLQPGQLVIVATAPRRDAFGVLHGETRSALLMVHAVARGGGPTVRLVLDFGGPDGTPATDIPVLTAAPAAPPRRGPGRPRGSRTRKKAANGAAGPPAAADDAVPETEEASGSG